MRCQDGRDACEHVIQAEGVIKAMDDRLEKVEGAVASLDGKVSSLNGKMDLLVQMSEESAQSRQDLAANMERFIGQVQSALNDGKARMDDLENKAKDVQPVGDVLKAIKAMVVKIAAIAFLGAFVISALALAGGTKEAVKLINTFGG